MKYFIVSALVLLSFTGFSAGHSVTAGGKPVCPVCKKQKNTIPVVYGKPGQAAMQKAEKGLIKLGGCVIGENAPRHFCKKDQQYF